jgi:putative ABC transport system permease protein
MIRPRWQKILTDFTANPVRSLLVVLSISVGLFAVGSITNTHLQVERMMRDNYAAINPANVYMVTSPLSEEDLFSLRRMDGVADVEGVNTANLRVRNQDGDWIRLNVIAPTEFEEMKTNQVLLLSGSFPPGDRELALDQYKLSEIALADDNTVEIQTPSGNVHRVKVSGVVQNQTIGASRADGGFFLAPAQAYTTWDSLPWLEQPQVINQVYVTSSGDADRPDDLRALAGILTGKLEKDGHTVYSYAVNGRHDHPNSNYIEALASILVLLGLLVIFLSGFLITNTLQALLAQQVQQIGIMKSVGATSGQIAFLYLALIEVYGIIAFVLSIYPIRWMTGILLSLMQTGINVPPQEGRLLPETIIIVAILALAVPAVAGSIPILRATSIGVQEALSGISPRQSALQEGLILRVMRRMRGLPRPLLVSLRNTFRRRIRLILTLITLTLGGAVFIATINTRISIQNYIDRLRYYFLADVTVTLQQPYRISQVRSDLMNLPEIGLVEGWNGARAELILPNGSGESISILAPPAGSQMVQPILLQGRWLDPLDAYAIAVNERFLDIYPGLSPGDSLNLRMNGRQRTWTVTGVFQLVGKSAGYLAYANGEMIQKELGQSARTSNFRILARESGLTLQQQKALGRKVEAALEQSGYHISEVTAGLYLKEISGNGLDLLTAVLLLLATLIAAVGAIGLMGTMSMNVMERTREIGVMRAIGAGNRQVMSIVLVEGVLIGLISWGLSTLTAIPISKLLADSINQAIFGAPAELTFDLWTILLWLGVVLALSIFASLIPARSAARLTIREVLAYE